MKLYRNGLVRNLIMGSGALLASPLAFAIANIAADVDVNTAGNQASTNAQPGAAVDVDINFTGDGVVTNISGQVTYDNTKVSIVSNAGGAGTCTVGVSVVAFTTTSGSGTALGNTKVCDLTVTVLGAVVPPSSTILGFASLTFADSNSTDTNSPGTINIVSGPVAPTAALGTVTQPAGGAAGGTGAGSVVVNVTDAGSNTGGAASLGLSCTIPAGSNNFLVTSGGTRNIAAPAVVGANAPPIGVSCVRGATLASATLTCVQTASPAAVRPDLTAQIDCPAGGVTPPSIAYSPNFGTTINYTGNAGVTVNKPIAVTQTAQGQVGSSTVVTNCVAPTGFTVTGFPITFTGGQANAGGTLATSCVVPVAGSPNLSGSLTCDETKDSGAGGIQTVSRAWTLNCPAAAPNFNSSPAVGGTLSLSGPPGTVASGSVNVNNNGTANLDFTCTAGSFTVTNGAAVGLVPGGSQSISVSCTTPSTPGTTITDTLTCTTNDPDFALAPATINLSCAALIVSIPTISAAGKGLLAILVMGLGLLGFALRRKQIA